MSVKRERERERGFMFARRRKMVWSILVGVILVCAVLGLTVARNLKVKPEPAVATSNQLPVVREPVQNVRFTVYDAGIFPQQQRARPGLVAISIEDRSHRSTGLVVQREAGGTILSIGQVSPALNQGRGTARFSLGAGHYSVFDANQPNNRAELVIEP
jgi:hypothetical protein